MRKNSAMLWKKQKHSAMRHYYKAEMKFILVIGACSESSFMAENIKKFFSAPFSPDMVTLNIKTHVKVGQAHCVP